MVITKIYTKRPQTEPKVGSEWLLECPLRAQKRPQQNPKVNTDYSTAYGCIKQEESKRNKPVTLWLGIKLGLSWLRLPET